MKLNILKMSLTAALAALSLAAAAQNLDPTVVVNRAYEGKLLEVNRPMFEMHVPDTVKQFALDFDYSVFENPYKGSYDFKPYQLLMKPMASNRDFSRFWLKAGAGYTLYPELGLVWTPAMTGKFKMNVYGDYDGYIGSYRTFMPNMSDNGQVVLERWRNADRKSKTWNGYRMKAKAGIDGSVDLKKAVVNFDVAYRGIAAKDTLKGRMYNGVDARVNVASRPSGSDYFLYDITAAYRFGKDALRYRSGEGSVTENIFEFDATLGRMISGTHNILMDAGFDYYSYAGDIAGGISELSLAPHYVFGKDRWDISVGLLVAKMIKTQESEHFDSREQLVYPDIDVRYALIKDAMSVYAKVGGGNRVNTYSSLLERNPYLHLSYGNRRQLLDLSVERISVAVGVDGRISKRFTYNVNAGFAAYGNGLLEKVAIYSDAEGGSNYGLTYDYASYNKLFVGLGWNWHTDDISFNGSAEYAHYSAKDSEGLFLPSALTGDVAFEYNWNRRLFLGVDCRFATEKKGVITRDDDLDLGMNLPMSAVIPGYADLGVYAEYSLNRKLSFWLRGGNLMNATVQYAPLYAEKGINFTAGICLKL